MGNHLKEGTTRVISHITFLQVKLLQGSAINHYRLFIGIEAIDH